MRKRIQSISLSVLTLSGSLAMGQSSNVVQPRPSERLVHFGPTAQVRQIRPTGALGWFGRRGPSISNLRQLRPSESATELKRPAPVARLSDAVTIRADQPGDPMVNFSAGRDLVPAFKGSDELVTALQNNIAQPASLTSEDVDGDGVADLVCGYANNGKGIIAIYRGNLDVMYSTRSVSGEVTDESPFLPQAIVVAVPTAADFVRVGDFNGDGIPDLIAATRGTNQLHFFAGTGGGEFSPVSEFQLPGVVTSLETGDVNRRDGLADIAVAVTGAGGSKLLVYEGPNGALKAEPESISLPGPGGSIAIGHFDDDYWVDIAVAAGRKLVIVHGRDRMLTLDTEQRKEVVPVSKDSISTAFDIASISAGDFAAKGRTAIALLATDGSVHIMERTTRKGNDHWAETPASGVMAGPLHGSGILRGRVSGSKGDNLVLLNESAKEMQVFSLDGKV
ncbi:MAG: FG-GAP repeat domain-containing protein, partial [Blastocatellia bacterium]